MNTKQQQLLFDKGITNVPSDALCSDNALAESIGLVYDDGEHRVIQGLKQYIYGIDPHYSLMYVHHVNNTEHYIMLDSSTTPNSIKWGTRRATGEYVPAKEESSPDVWTDIVLRTVTTNTKITSIGRTLIISDDSSMMYFVWDDNGYKNIVYPIPDLKFEAKLVNTSAGVFITNSGDASELFETIDYYDDTQVQDYKLNGGKQDVYNDLAIGLYAKNKKQAAKSKMFVEPFFVRAALEMYDGSYTYITNPILLNAAVDNNTLYYVRGKTSTLSGRDAFVIKQLVAVTQATRLYIKQSQDFSDYSDIIKDVVVFATKGINIYNTTEDQRMSTRNNDICGAGVWSFETVTEGVLTASIYGTTAYNPSNYAPEGHDDLEFCPTRIRCLSKREQKSINDDIESESVFYKIASLGLKNISGFEDLAKRTTGEIIENITTQEYLEYDDYYSRCSLVPKFTYVYNARLNVANTSRSFFPGFGFFMPNDNYTGASYTPVKYDYTFDVTIKIETGDVHVIHKVNTEQKQGIYFYYPDSRAKHVKIYKHTTLEDKLLLDVNLKEHPNLNGAYYYAGYSSTSTEPAGTALPSGETIPTESVPSPENLYNYLIQSEVNNPWVFIAKGYNAISTGNIIGMSTITQALSEGQFGQYPLLVFTDTGIWAMAVDNTGLYQSIHPMSREVCNNAVSITQTDGAVFFSSAKGLMAVVGNQVKCVSEQLSGMEDSFAASMFSTERLGNPLAFFKNCRIAYDYRDSLLWLFSTSGGASCCYIYSIKTGTFSKYNIGSLVRCVNNYPDYLIQIPSSSNMVFSLLKRPAITSDYQEGSTVNFRQYTANILTRPMKFENALALKSIMQVKHIKQFSPYTITTTETDPETQEPVSVETPYKASITFRLFASNNLENWVELSSLRGVPWKYYRFRLDFANLIATDRYAGTMLITQERRTDKLR